MQRQGELAKPEGSINAAKVNDPEGLLRKGNSPFVILTDRSRTIAYQRCPRKRYWTYEYAGRGVQRLRMSIPLTVGIHFHSAVAHLLKWAKFIAENNSKSENQIAPREFVRAIIQSEKKSYFASIRSRGFEVGDDEDEFFVAHEQAALIEGLVWAYWHRGLPKLLEEFQILEVEQEDVLRLALLRMDGNKGLFPLTSTEEMSYRESTAEGEVSCFGDTVGPLVWQSRADALIKDRESEDLYVLSFKTAGAWEARKDHSNKHDMQGVSESVSIEDRLNIKVTDGGKDFLIDGVKMEFILKGERRKPFEEAEGKIQYSPLIRPWKLRDDGLGVVDLDNEYKWKWEWKDEEGRKRRLSPKKYSPIDVWREGEIGVEAWVDMLASGEVQPEAGDCLESQLILPMPYFRNPLEMRSWRLSVTAQETQVANDSQMIESLRLAQSPLYNDHLDLRFPQYQHSCDYPTRCDCYDLCYGGKSPQEVNPFEEGLYRWREAHHKPEMDMMEKSQKE